MKKIAKILGGIVALALLVCMFIFGKEKYYQLSELPQDQAAVAQSAGQLITDIVTAENQGQKEQVLASAPGWEPVFTSWETGMEEVGQYVSIKEYNISVDEKSAVANVRIVGTELDPEGKARTAVVQVIYSQQENVYPTLTVNTDYTLGEKLEKAGLNTLLGMGTVFAILILISLIISAFAGIPKLQAKFSKKETKADETKTAVDNTIAQIIENEELSDDSELVAVISAAVAAYEAQAGNVSGDGFVVRSIRRANTSKWQRA